MTQVTFKESVRGVCCETGSRVQLKKGSKYKVLDQRVTHGSYYALGLEDPKETYQGGPDGKTALPCTIRVQVPLEAVTIK